MPGRPFLLVLLAELWWARAFQVRAHHGQYPSVSISIH